MPLTLGERCARMGLVILALNGLVPGPPAVAEETIKLGGTGTAIGAMKLIVAVFEKENPGIAVAIMPSMGSSGGIQAVSKGALDIGLISRPLQGGELTQGLSQVEYAKTPFILITQKNGSLSGLSSEDMIKIFRGEMRTWPNGEQIRLVRRPASDTDTAIAKSISPAMSMAVDAALSREGMLMALTDQENVDLIEKIPGALGFSTLGQVFAEKRNVKILSLNGVTPSTKTLTNGSYPLFKPLYMATKAGPLSPVHRFINFMRSAECRRILQETGNVPTLTEVRR